MEIITTKAGKMLAEIKSTSATTKAPHGSFEAVLSVPTLDRDGEVVDAKAFDPLPDHITIDVDHAMTVEKTVASGRPYYDGDVLKFEGTYASHPLAQMVRSLVDEGHIRTMSVAYMSGVFEVDEKDGRPHLRKAELLNAGIVGIPANREALITASKSLAGATEEPEVKAGARHASADLALMQAAHDALVKLGVSCETKSEEPAKSATTEIATETTPETKAAAPAAAESPASVDVVLARARALAAEADLSLI